jgi:hypothetical protein
LKEIAMSKNLLALALPLALVATACSKHSAVPADAQKTADVLTGDAKGSADSNPLCQLFTLDEIASYEGAPVAAGTNAAMGTGCQWVNRQGQESAMLQVVPARYFEAASEAPGYKELPEAGEKGFVVPQMGGWQAGAIKGQKAVMVSTGASSSEAKATGFLKEAMKRVTG